MLPAACLPPSFVVCRLPSFVLILLVKYHGLHYCVVFPTQGVEQCGRGDGRVVGRRGDDDGPSRSLPPFRPVSVLVVSQVRAPHLSLLTILLWFFLPLSHVVGRALFCLSSSVLFVCVCVYMCVCTRGRDQIVDDLVVMILKRAEMGKNYGVVMLPEGLIEFIPEFNALISDINDVLASGIPTTIGKLFSIYGVISFRFKRGFS